ncbi:MULTISPECIES: hypothetical protein [Parvimonas]|uniref:Uncharacterized protein n=1 Tax=Parvimonas parva TaxID=2769485 RepID=A0ABS1C6W9_9FIRM|nr:MULTISPECIES: hypothetical protein [Parvimonas]KXB66122.1 hypothetical protein HMPREF3181_00867 [Parvimonas sp. KA00067]MBK1467795.1 hypothetical protein [Parvimonas parva]
MSNTVKKLVTNINKTYLTDFSVFGFKFSHFNNFNILAGNSFFKSWITGFSFNSIFVFNNFNFRK